MSNLNLDVYTNISLDNKDELFDWLSSKAKELNIVKDENDFKKALIEREKLGTTGLENMIAIPHAISEKINKQYVIVVSLKKTIEYETLDKTNVKTIICMSVPKKTAHIHLDILQQISVMLLNKENQDILNLGKKNKIIQLFKEIKFNEIKNNIDKKSEEKEINKNGLNKNINLIDEIKVIKKSNLSNIEKSNNIKKLKKEIKICKKNIVENKKNYIQEKKKIVNLHKIELKKIKNDLVNEKKNVKNLMNIFNENSKNELKEIKLNKNYENNKNEYLVKFYRNNFEEKNKLSQKLNFLKQELSNNQKHFKEQKNNCYNKYLSLMIDNKNKIISSKNYVYKHIDKIIFVMVLSMIVLGLWSIVLGSFGVTNYSKLLLVDVETYIPELNGGKNNNDWLVVFNNWKLQMVSNDYYFSLFAIIFGSLSFVIAIPLKFFKVSNVYHEKTSYVLVSLMVITIVFLIVYVSMSYVNIYNYNSFSKDANELNHSFSSLSILSQPLKEQKDFASVTDYNNYIDNILLELKKWDSTINSVTQDNITKAKSICLTQCTTVFKQIVIGTTF